MEGLYIADVSYWCYSGSDERATHLEHGRHAERLVLVVLTEELISERASFPASFGAESIIMRLSVL